LIRHAPLRSLNDAQSLIRVSASPLGQARAGDRYAHVLGDARLQPAEEAVGGRDRTAAQQALGEQQARGRGGVTAGKRRGIAEGAPPVSLCASAESMTAQRKPVRGVHPDFATLQPEQKSRV
jgi:hypothetical protein